MPSKRGRPPSNDNADAITQRRRQLTAERVRALRQRQAAQTLTNAAANPLTPAQSLQRDIIVRRPFQDDEAAATLPELGLRIENLSLDTDADAAEEQQQATNLYDHDDLYEPNSADKPDPAPSTPNRARISPSSPSSFSPSHAGGSNHHRPLSVSRRHPNESLSPQDQLILSPTLPKARIHNIRALPDSSDDDSTPFLEPLRPPNISQEVEQQLQNDLQAGIGDELQQEIHIPAAIEEGWEETDTPALAEERVERVDDDSFHAFRSEHASEHSSEEELSDMERTVEKLFNDFQHGTHGCSREEHELHLNKHLRTHRDNHHSLHEISSDPAFYTVMSHFTDLITSKELDQQTAPTADQWNYLFCGLPPGQRSRRPIQVCLHKEETREVIPDVAFDIDSFLGFASSLAVARQGVWFQPAPQFRQNLKTDVHLRTAIYTAFGASTRPAEPDTEPEPDPAPRPTNVLLKDCPHFYFGRVEGAQDISVYILFPHLPLPRDKFIALTNEQLLKWFNEIFLPILSQHYGSHYMQHLPRSYEHSLASSRARHVESRSVDGASYNAQQSLHYFLQPHHLHSIWEKVVTRSEDSIYQEPLLHFSAKGTKLQFKTSPTVVTLLDTMQHFEAYFERVMDLNFIYRESFYVDIGKEICPTATGPSPGFTTEFDDEPQVYLWRQCCLQKHFNWIYDGAPPKSGLTYYHVSMLRDACNATNLYPKKSFLRRGGLLYTQYYASIKETFDAAKTFPFQNDNLEEMALDPQIRQAARHTGQNTGRYNPQIIEKAYCHSKRRVFYGLRDSKHQSFGVRGEHRVAWSLFEALCDRLAEIEPEDLLVLLPDCPSSVWPVKTPVFTQYLQRNVDKFAAGFEVLRLRSEHGLVTWEQTKMMAMFLRCLRFSLHAHQLSRESALWWGRRERRTEATAEKAATVQTWVGLGFSNTLPQYGYCWMEPRLDWEQLKFIPRFSDDMLFGNHALQNTYLRRGGQVRDFHDVFLLLELAIEFIQEYHDNERISSRVLKWAVHLCLHQFRIDTLDLVSKDIREPLRESALEGRTPFSYEYLDRLMEDGVHVVSGNKCAVKNPLELAHLHFDFEDGRKRTHWDDKPYRMLFQRFQTALGLQPTTRPFGKLFRRLVWTYHLTYHWVLPYPNETGFMQVTKSHERMWYSIMPPTEARAWSSERLKSLEARAWVWGKKDHRRGQPPLLPQYLYWEQVEWRRWIESITEAS